MFWRGRKSAPRPDCGELELRFALELPNMVLSQHRSKIEEIRLSHPHSVNYCDEQPSRGVCLPYALSLLGEPNYERLAAIAIAVGHTGVFVGTDLAGWLLDGRLTEISQREGALVLYFKYELWAHAGRVIRPGRVRSKWGECPVYEHGTWEVPCRYGDSVRYFEMPPRDLFQEYAASKGILGII